MATVRSLISRVEAALAEVAEGVLAPDDELLFHAALTPMLVACESGCYEAQPGVNIALALRVPESEHEGAWSSSYVVVPLATVLDPQACMATVRTAIEDTVFTRQAAGMPDLGDLGSGVDDEADGPG